MSSGTANQTIFDRFDASGKGKLILLVITDLDPGGDNIAQNFLHYMIRDAGLDEEQVQAWKVALTMGQVLSEGLPESFERVKPKDPSGPAYITKYGTDHVWEPTFAPKQKLTTSLVAQP